MKIGDRVIIRGLEITRYRYEGLIMCGPFPGGPGGVPSVVVKWVYFSGPEPPRFVRLANARQYHFQDIRRMDDLTVILSD